MVNEEFEIEEHAPVRRRLRPFPLDQMDIGHSFVVDIDDDQHRIAIGQRLHRYNKKNPPKRFTMRKLNDRQVRVFREEDAL